MVYVKVRGPKKQVKTSWKGPLVHNLWGLWTALYLAETNDSAVSKVSTRVDKGVGVNSH